MELDAITITLVLASIGLGISATVAIIGLALALVGGVTFIFIALVVVKASKEFDEWSVDSSKVKELSERIQSIQQHNGDRVNAIRKCLVQLETGSQLNEAQLTTVNLCSKIKTTLSSQQKSIRQRKSP